MPGYAALLIEDFKEFRRFVLSSLQQTAKFQAIYEASDGLEGVQRANELQPDLIVLDIGLPKLDGIEVARRIRKVSANSKILFWTQESITASAEASRQKNDVSIRGVRAYDRLVRTPRAPRDER
jgi:CheY-like chemotaxis protein